MKRTCQFPTQTLLIVIGALLFIPFLGNVHLFDWDEINFAESAREMLLTHNYRTVQINFESFYEKPPLFIWLQAFSMNCFGVNEFAARLPNALCGIITMLAVFRVGRSVFTSQLGVLWALLFAGSILPQIYFKSGIIDPVFNLFIFLGIFFIFKVSVANNSEPGKGLERNRRINLVLSGLFIGLAALTKGPVAILVSVLTASVCFLMNRGKLKIKLGEIIGWGVVVFLVGLAWLSFEIRANGMHFVNEFVRYQIRLFSTKDAGHGGAFYYHFLVLIIGVFPASALIVDAFRKNAHDDFAQKSFKQWMICLLLVVLVIFSIVQTKIIHYSSLCYFPITFLAAYYLHYLFEDKMRWTWRQTVPLLAIGALIVVAVSGIILLVQHPDAFIHYIKDDFARACLQATVDWSNGDIIFGWVYAACILIAIRLAQTRHVKLGAYLIIISSALFVNILAGVFVPRAEQYSQAALIEFLESKQNENCVIETARFKSYAHYFYARKPVPSASDSSKTVYVITKVNKADAVLLQRNDLKELYRKNGWVFFEKSR